ncbi:DUF2742 domain-containing protein [Rhodococcus sp. 114MFTsu3.1]|uniref:DUF2742 domain-containing protein n=1 Tax=Rhodococcus sp. 114MFTsu3.1 TaxID=1172184 RepID=UPI0009DC08E2|nr:DUF2742 domain-containing protein [Rhodococcus sp. 114MFTsu3.1]
MSTPIPFAPLLIGGPESREVDFLAVHERLSPILTSAQALGGVPIIGSPSWVELDDQDVRWRHAVVVSGYRWALEQWLRQDAAVDFSHEFSQSRDWAATSRYIRQRREWLANNSWYSSRRSA